jgi:hypothetical protein
MLPDLQLTVGKGYVNEDARVVCEVIELDRNAVRYKTYFLATGEMFGPPLKSPRREFMRWTSREATHEEMASLETKDPDALFGEPMQTQKTEPDISLDATLIMNRQSSTLR